MKCDIITKPVLLSKHINILNVSRVRDFGSLVVILVSQKIALAHPPSKKSALSFTILRTICIGEKCPFHTISQYRGCNTSVTPGLTDGGVVVVVVVVGQSGVYYRLVCL